ncbi:hypothetical protein Tco_1527744, partial [Tanacetum coccineum]
YGSESHNRNLQAVLTNDVVSCSTLSNQGYAKDFYDLDVMHHSKRQSHHFLLVMLRLELHIFFVLAVGRCGRRFSILNCFNLGGVNVNSLTVNHVPEKLHDTDPEITFRELGI